MRKNVTLHIGDIRADLDSNALILFNYTQEDLQNPTIVKNSYSQQVTLKGTDVNNRIFGTYFRNDRVSDGGFNALQKTPFTIYNEMNEILESGYCKLESVERKGADISYKVSLYGGLGGFFYGLMYDADGNKRNLADLIYTSGGDSHEFDFAINKDAVASAWKRLQGDSTQDVIWDHINFAPCYNGLPGGGFAADKALCPDGCYGVKDSYEEGGVTYNSKNGNVLVKLAGKYDEWAVGDLRSYLQRPVVRMKSIIDAIADSSQNGGYTVELDSSFFKNANDYYKNAWITLPRLDSIQMPVNGGNSTAIMPDGLSTEVTESTTKDTSLPEGSKALNMKYECTAVIQPGLQVTDLQALDRYITVHEGNVCRRVLIVYQLLGYNSEGILIAGSNVIGATTSIVKAAETLRDYENITNTRSWLQEYNESDNIPNDKKYTIAWGNWNNVSSNLVIGTKFHNGLLVDSNGDPKTVTLTLTGNGISMVRVRTTVLAMTEAPSQAESHFIYNSAGRAYIMEDGFATTYVAVDGMNYDNGEVSYSWTPESAQIRSGALVSKQILLGGTDSPADYLLSFCKMFGLQFLFDSAHKKVKIVTRNTLYKPNNGNTRVYDLDTRIDRASMSITPYVLDSRWYEFGNPYLKGAWADYYEEVKGIRYGMQRVNTGFSFNANRKDVLKDININGACEVLEQNKYFVNITQSGKVCPAVFLDGGTFTLWDSSGNNKDLDIQMPTPSATIDYINQTYKGYDYPFYAKLQFHDKDNKALDGSNVMVLFVGSGYPDEYARFCLTDDVYMMIEMNEGTPCWLIGQSTVSAGYCINVNLKYPCFRRYIPNGNDHYQMDLSLDFGTPLEVCEPNISFPNPDTTNIYAKGWKLYIQDRYDEDTRIVRCKVNLRGLGEQIGQNLMRNFYYFDSSYWVLNKITNYSITTEDLVDCEFIKVKSTTNYSAGQTY
jgi:hypothetical protein